MARLRAMSSAIPARLPQLQAQSERGSNGESSAGDIVYKSGDIVGQSGVELMYENLLQGIRGEREQVRVDSGGDVLELEGSVPPRAGSDIKLTLDIKIRKLEEGLLKAMEIGKRQGNASNAGACICMDCRNGEILGMASEPTFDFLRLHRRRLK